jgi:hypothetical protein
MSATAFQRARRELAAREAAQAAEQVEVQHQVQPATTAEKPIDQKPIDKMTKAELVAQAADLQLATDGTVAELRVRIKAAKEAAQQVVGGGGAGGS